jgi:hypothetical protein
MVNPGSDRRGLPEVTPQRNHTGMRRVLAGKLFQFRQAVILAAIVNVDYLPLSVQGCQSSTNGLMEEIQAVNFVVNGDYDG